MLFPLNPGERVPPPEGGGWHPCGGAVGRDGHDPARAEGRPGSNGQRESQEERGAGQAQAEGPRDRGEQEEDRQIERLYQVSTDLPTRNLRRFPNYLTICW